MPIHWFFFAGFRGNSKLEALANSNFKNGFELIQWGIELAFTSEGIEGKEYVGQSVDKMPLSMFYTEGICLDFSHKEYRELITSLEIKVACDELGLEIKKDDTVLFYTDHYRKSYQTDLWANGPGLSVEAARWLGEQGISAFGVETMSPGVSGVSNKEVHALCGELNFTHYENLINLHQLIGRGRFRFIGLPLKIRGGTGSPVCCCSY